MLKVCFGASLIFLATACGWHSHLAYVLFFWKQGKTTPSFEEKWPKMRPTVLKVLKQEPVTQMEWQDLFYDVHQICLWDEKGATKIYECLHDDIVAFINVRRESEGNLFRRSLASRYGNASCDNLICFTSFTLHFKSDSKHSIEYWPSARNKLYLKRTSSSGGNSSRKAVSCLRRFVN